MSENIAKAAEEIADDDIIMDSYKAFYQGKGYFFDEEQYVIRSKTQTA